MLKINNVTISYQDCGNVIVVYLKGNKNDINERFNSFYNHQATNATTLEWDDEDMCHFFVHSSGKINGKKYKAKEKVLFAFEMAERARLIQSSFIRGYKSVRDMVRQAKVNALKMFSQMNEVDYYYTSGVNDIEYNC